MTVTGQNLARFKNTQNKKLSAPCQWVARSNYQRLT